MLCRSLLIVDDDPNLAGLLLDLFVSRGHSVRIASNGVEALESIGSSRPDMVISDIQMPIMNGFELFEALDRDYPSLKKVMMTGCDIDEHLTLIRERNVGNIFMKGGEFHLNEIVDYIETLLSGEIFGLAKRFPNTPIKTLIIRSEEDASKAREAVLANYWGDDRMLLEIALNELISNAVFHGALQLSQVSRDTWNDSYAIDDDRPVKVSFAIDSDRIGVSVEDPAGGLKKSDVLRWLDHPVTDPADGEEHGRGLMLIRRLIDRFIINIEPGRRTECILIQYKDRSLKGLNKPIIIHEI